MRYNFIVMSAILAFLAIVGIAAPAPNHGGKHNEIVDRIRVQTNQIICTPDERSSPLLASVDYGLKTAFEWGNDASRKCQPDAGAKTKNCFAYRIAGSQPWYDFRIAFGFVPPAGKAVMNYKRFVYEIEGIRNVCETHLRTNGRDANGNVIIKKVASGIKLAKIWINPENTLEDRYAWIVLRGLNEAGYSIEGATGLTFGNFGTLKFTKPISIYKGAVAVRASPNPNPPSPVRHNSTTEIEEKNDEVTDDRDIRQYHTFSLTDTVEFELPPGGRMMTAEDWDLFYSQNNTDVEADST